ncbi:MAG: ATPase domain-containing protein [Desulfurococcaceae archaeon]
MEAAFTTGNRELDGLLGGIPSRYMLLVVGHPGSGKTTLASQICYANTRKGYKCLYVTFYEEKDKLYRHMNMLGIRLAEAERNGLLTYAKLPVAGTDEILNALTGLISRDSYKVVVIDSVNPVLELIERKRAQRAVLLNFFYQLTGIIDGLLVIVAEVPLGREAVDLGAVEFVADAIFYLKHRIERGLVSRLLEIRKVREARITVVELPFTIGEAKGVKVFVPPRPERPLTTLRERLKALRISEKLTGYLYRGDIVTHSSPPHIHSPLIYIPIVDIAVENDMKVLIITFRYSRDEYMDLVLGTMVNGFGLSEGVARCILENYFHVEAVNPSSYSLSQLFTYIVELIERHDPGVVVFHVLEVLWAQTHNKDEFWNVLTNLFTWLKNGGKLTVHLTTRVSPYWIRMNEVLSDVTIRFYCKPRRGGFKQVMIVWRRGKAPTRVDLDEGELVEEMKRSALVFAEIVRGRVKACSSSA